MPLQTHTLIDTRLCMCNGTFEHLGALNQLLACYIRSSLLIFLLFLLFFSCSVWWHFMLKQWEPPPSTIFSSATNYFDGGWPPLLQGVSWWYFSFYTHTYIHIVWSSEQQREFEPIFDSHNWLGQMSTLSSLYSITLASIIQCSYMCMRVQISSTTCPSMMPLFVLSTFFLLSAFFTSFSNSWRPSSQDNSITFL
jgi:hypothetical protein